MNIWYAPWRCRGASGSNPVLSPWSLAALLYLGSGIGLWIVVSAMLLGFASYSMSLTLFVIGLRQLGTARTGAYFSIAPFFGALFSVLLLGESVTIPLLVAGALMALGTWLHLTERHEHRHRRTLWVIRNFSGSLYGRKVSFLCGQHPVTIQFSDKPGLS